MTMHGYGSFAKYYDQLTQNISYGERAAYFDAIIKQNMDSASVIADLACGTGSLSFELADLGYDVVGVEHAVAFDVEHGGVHVAARTVVVGGVHVDHQRFACHLLGMDAGGVGEPL